MKLTVVLFTWKNAKIMIITQKGNKKDLNNYRPICLLSNCYKVFTKVPMNRLEKTLDENHPREPAGFRGGHFTSLYFIVLKKDMHFTTHDHI